MNLSQGVLSRARECCGHASSNHVWRYEDQRKDPTTLYCNTCRTVCVRNDSAAVTRGASASSAAAPASKTTGRAGVFNEIMADLERGPVATARPTTRVQNGAFDRLADDLQRESARLASGRPATFTRSATSPAPDSSAVRYPLPPPSPFERLVRDLETAARPRVPTWSETYCRASSEERATMRRDHERENEMREYRRLGAEYRAALRACAEERRELLDRAGAELEAACR